MGRKRARSPMEKHMPGNQQSNEKPFLQAADAFIIAALIAVVLFYFRSLLWTTELIYGGLDITRQFYVFKKVSHEALSNGEWPLWMPYIYCGMPLLAASIETPFHPLDLLLAFLPVPLNMVFNWTLIAHLVAAELFSYLLFKRMFRSTAIAAFCSLWIWSPFVLNSIETGDTNNVRAILMTPIILYFTESAVSHDGTFSDFLWGGVAIAVQVLCGGLQYVFYTLLFVTAYSGFMTLRSMPAGKALRGRVIGLAVMALIGLTLPAIQLLPALEYARLSVRSQDIPWFSMWSLEPRQLIDYLVPFCSGEELSFGYFGVSTIVLAVSCLVFWRSPRKYFFLAAGAIALINGLGTSTWLSHHLVSLPIVRGLRGPFRATLFFNLSCTILAGGALYGLVNDSRDREGGKHRLWLLFLSILMLGGFLAVSFRSANRFQVMLSLGLLVATCGLVWVALLYPRRAKAVAFLAVVLLAADFGIRFRDYYDASPTSLFERDSTVNWLAQQDSGHRLLVRGTAHSNYFALFGIDAANGHHAFPPLRTARFLPLLANGTIASLADVQYEVLYLRDENGRPFHPPTRSPDSVRITRAAYEPMGRATIVNSFRVTEPENVPGVLAGSDFDPRAEAILEESPPRRPGPNGIEGATGSASVEDRSLNRVTVRTTTESDSLLLFSESNYPGWTATVDGLPARVYTADYLFQAVFVPAGSHMVEFYFHPFSFTAGAIVSAASLVAVVIALAVLNRRDRCPEATPE